MKGDTEKYTENGWQPVAPHACITQNNKKAEKTRQGLSMNEGYYLGMQIFKKKEFAQYEKRGILKHTLNRLDRRWCVSACVK